MLSYPISAKYIHSLGGEFIFVRWSYFRMVAIGCWSRDRWPLEIAKQSNFLQDTRYKIVKKIGIRQYHKTDY